MAILQPTYSEYERCAESRGATIVRIPLTEEHDFAAASESVLPFVDPNLKMVILCNPNNPTGSTIPRSDVLTILKAVDERTLVLVDEAYVEYCPEVSVLGDVETWPNLIVVRTFSKAYALSGMRVGFAAMGGSARTEFSKAIRHPWTVGILSLVAAEAALDDQAYLKSMVASTITLREHFATELSRTSRLRPLPSRTGFFLTKLETDDISPTRLCDALQSLAIFVRRFGKSSAPLERRYIRLTTQGESANSRMIKSIREVMGAVSHLPIRIGPGAT